MHVILLIFILSQILAFPQYFTLHNNYCILHTIRLRFTRVCDVGISLELATFQFKK